MLTLRNTPNLAGIQITGDYLDLNTLYSSLHTIVGDEGQFRNYEGARLRILGVCYDIRHAFQGDREVEFIENGMDTDKMKFMGLIAPESNVYYKVNIYYPEILFVTIALNDFIHLYAKKQAKTSPFPLLDKKNQWDSSIANVRLFQSLVVNCVKEIVTDASFKQMMNLMDKNNPKTDEHVTQYLDLLNIRYLKIGDREERGKALPTMVKRMVEKGKEYRELEERVRTMARDHGSSTEDISLVADYPEVEW